LQRLGIAAALVTDPEILILDEPNSALDPIGRADVRDIITEQKRHRCILLSSHMLSEVEQLADHIVVIDQGRVVTQGNTAWMLTNGCVTIRTMCVFLPNQLIFNDLIVIVLHSSFA